MLLVQSREVSKEASPEIAFTPSLMLYVDEEERIAIVESSFDDQVSLVASTRRDVRKDFLVQKHNRSALDILADLGKKQVQEFEEESRE